MKLLTRISFLAAFLCCANLLQSYKSVAPALTGAWSYETPESKTVMIFSDNVFAVAQYDVSGKKFLNSWGGTWKQDGKTLIRKMEWNAQDSTTVGGEITNKVNITNNDKLTLENTGIQWNRLDDGTPGALAGAWIITGNYNNDKVSKRPNPFYPRRTMKVLSGKYFHWIAYNVATKQFMNAGGGTYTTANGKYTENIEFFTKTAESIGKSLTFDYSFVDGDWRHKGEKSTGGPMDECWSRRAMLEK
jgi:hypothetical protein